MKIENKVLIAKIVMCNIVLSLSLMATDPIAENVVLDPNDPQISIIQDEKGLSFEIKKPKINVEKELFKQDALKLGQPACFFTTDGDPCLRVSDSAIDKAILIECGCYDSETGQNRHIQKPQDLENLKAIWLIENLYGFNCQTNKKYRGEEESFVGKLLEKVFVPNDEYPGKPLVDEYKAHIPMFWTLKNSDEFKAISKYMLQNLAEQEYIPTEKTLLVLRIENDPKFETLDEKDREFLNTYFELFNLNDKEIKNFFEAHKELIIKSFNYLNDPTMIKETTTQGIFRRIDDFYKGFNISSLAIIASAFLITDIIRDEVKDIYHALVKNATGKETLVRAIITSKP